MEPIILINKMNKDINEIIKYVSNIKILCDDIFLDKTLFNDQNVRYRNYCISNFNYIYNFINKVHKYKHNHDYKCEIIMNIHSHLYLIVKKINSFQFFIKTLTFDPIFLSKLNEYADQCYFFLNKFHYNNAKSDINILPYYTILTSEKIYLYFPNKLTIVNEHNFDKYVNSFKPLNFNIHFIDYKYSYILKPILKKTKYKKPTFKKRSICKIYFHNVVLYQYYSNINNTYSFFNKFTNNFEENSVNLNKGVFINGKPKYSI